MYEATIEHFKAQLQGGGIRPSMFRVEIAPPNQLSRHWDARKLSFLCKASSVPSHVITPVSIGLPGGGAVKLPGSKVFEPWSATIIADDNHRLRRDFEIWSEIIIGGENQLSDTELSKYMSTAIVTELDRAAKPIMHHTLEFLYPTNIGAMELSYDNKDVQEFEVTFAYHYHTLYEPQKRTKGNESNKPTKDFRER